MSQGPHEWKTVLAVRELNGYELRYQCVRLAGGWAHYWTAYRNGKIVSLGECKNAKQAKLNARRFAERKRK